MLSAAGPSAERAAAAGAHYGHVTDDATSHGTALERAVLGVTAEPPAIPRCRDVLRLLLGDDCGGAAAGPAGGRGRTHRVRLFHRGQPAARRPGGPEGSEGPEEPGGLGEVSVTGEPPGGDKSVRQ